MLFSYGYGTKRDGLIGKEMCYGSSSEYKIRSDWQTISREAHCWNCIVNEMINLKLITLTL